MLLYVVIADLRKTPGWLSFSPDKGFHQMPSLLNPFLKYFFRSLLSR